MEFSSGNIRGRKTVYYVRKVEENECNVLNKKVSSAL